MYISNNISYCKKRQFYLYGVLFYNLTLNGALSTFGLLEIWLQHSVKTELEAKLLKVGSEQIMKYSHQGLKTNPLSFEVNSRLGRIPNQDSIFAFPTQIKQQEEKNSVRFYLSEKVKSLKGCDRKQRSGQYLASKFHHVRSPAFTLVRLGGRFEFSFLFCCLLFWLDQFFRVTFHNKNHTHTKNIEY